MGDTLGTFTPPCIVRPIATPLERDYGSDPRKPGPDQIGDFLEIGPENQATGVSQGYEHQDTGWHR